MTTRHLIPITEHALKAARPDWPYSAWSTGHLVRTKRLGCVRVGRRVFLTSELLAEFIDSNTHPLTVDIESKAKSRSTALLGRIDEIARLLGELRADVVRELGVDDDAELRALAVEHAAKLRRGRSK